MKLERVLQGVDVRSAVIGHLAEATVTGLEYDSRRVEPGFLFFAFPGEKVDGRKFGLKAMAAGALAVVSELEAPPEFSGPWIRVAHGRQALATAAKNFYGAPDERLSVTGITGTNGKTTTSYLVDSVLRAAGYLTGIVGTIEYHLAGRVLKAANTTPESLDLLRIMDELARETRFGRQPGRTMEVSSTRWRWVGHTGCGSTARYLPI